ncbi:MAG: nucleoside triphosphate pyrophosphohydrolase [Pseudobdellovibrionaceae bacterium]|nr:nucleoside triphosphate pyrophosphohydrolase [Bdellovibrionales bacterium]USN48905.1 MAG: nucleoside triphosphate pyrophosphohydrolase [Pseudobdellovibrionaceae bacterium]
MPLPPKNFRDFSSFLQIVTDLRGPEGCPWDKEQNHQTLTQFALEEAFELAEAIDENDKNGMVEELGDVLLQVVLHAEIARQEGEFDIFDVIEGIGRKMVRRHPHVFDDTKVADSDEVLQNWAKIKAKESPKKAHEYISTPKGLPALIEAQKIGAKTKKFGFDWNEVDGVLKKIDEELAEFKQALTAGTVEEQQAELGDLLFTIAQMARHLNFDSEQSLRKTNLRFRKRFQSMMTLAADAGFDPHHTPPEKLEEFWSQAKKSETSTGE